MQESKKISIPLLIGGVVLVIAIGVGGVSIYLSNQASANNTATNTTGGNTPTPQPISSPVNSGNSGGSNQQIAKYKNGTYNATGAYVSPDGGESIDVSLTLNNDTITAVNVTPEGNAPTSRQYERLFSSGISGVVVGQKIDNVFINGSVNGSSLTGNGFNNALDQIKQQAQI